MRFFATCVLLIGSCVGAVILAGHFLWTPPSSAGEKKPVAAAGQKGGGAPAEEGPEPPPAAAPTREEKKPATPTIDDDKPAAYIPVRPAVGGPQPLVIQDARLLPLELQDVPAEHDGKLLFLGTEVRPGEEVPKDKLLEYEVSILVVPVTTWDGVAPKDRIEDPTDPTKRLYRRVRPTDDLAPGTTSVVLQKLKFRKLDVGDRVKAGQLLGVVNPDLALADLAIKQSKVEGAEAERRTSEAMWEESKRRLALLDSLRSRAGTRAVTEEDYGIARVTVTRYFQEEISKRAAGRQASRELSAALTTLNLHMVRASIDGVIKAVYKRRGEATKNLDPVLQIQNPDRLIVESRVDVQDALPLRDRWTEALKLRDRAANLRADAGSRGQPEPSEAKQLDDQANKLVHVLVEASRVDPPMAVLAGHLQEVTSVAVTSETEPRIVSGGEDNMVRIWQRIPSSDRWQEIGKLNHHSIVRSVTCTPPASKRQLLLTGTATGRGRLFDLGNLQAGETFLQGRHSGAILSVAFNRDGTLCATGGEDRAICLWETTEGKLLGRVAGAHRLGVTSLMFTAKDQVISAGRDKRLIVWDMVEGGEGGRTLTHHEVFDRRSGDVAQLGVDPTGEHVLFDDGRELRAMSLVNRKNEGTLMTASPTATFSTMALYSPDGNTILTNGNNVGRLQLWRAPSAKARPAELRQFIWSTGAVTCGAFSPDGKFAVTGTQDSRVVVWRMPESAEAQRHIDAQLSYVEEFLDTSLRQLTVRATLDNPSWIIPGSGATIVVPPYAVTR
jgi:WD40 repeat protein